jgi:hypothetical protein
MIFPFCSGIIDKSGGENPQRKQLCEIIEAVPIIDSSFNTVVAKGIAEEFKIISSLSLRSIFFEDF